MLPSERSPFKFLDPYGQEDRDIFFGREREIAGLYDMLRVSRLLLVYGATGTGKTSLINCGLANKFSETDWFSIFIRRGNKLTESLFREIRSRAIEPIPEDASLPAAVESLYLDHYIPVYLVFDQFEELFIMGDRPEQLAFFGMLKDLLESRVVCKVMIIVREEYLAWFSDFEEVVPALFENRFRVEHMSRSQLEEVIRGTVEAKQFGIELQEPDTFVPMILENLQGARKEIDLTNLQVYLDRLYRTDLAQQAAEGEERAVSFSPALVEKVGKLPKVLSNFLDEQLTEVERQLGKKGVALEVLMALVTDDGTKRSLSLPEMEAYLKEKRKIAAEDVRFCVEEFSRRKILRGLGG
jgi:AAA+ ATPase superfamily predicted ATPase